jgi:hydroxylaminobenzene mutase
LRLVQLGLVLFLAGLVTGFAVPFYTNPRMGISSHLEGILNGMFLMLAGVVWPRLRMHRMLLSTALWLAVYGTFANWLATLLAAWWGAGAAMPIAAEGHSGTPGQEMLITFFLLSLSAAMIITVLLLLWGLHRGIYPGSHPADG